MKPYDHKTIENNWRSHWFDNNIYKAVDFSPKPKKYILAELPYPSGKFLHVGHMMRYTVPEIYSRFLRMQGYNVLFPMGWDCFGLPAETFAIKEGVTPQEAIAGATKDYKKAMQGMGYAFDWDREINTSDPNFYKWTQLMFIKLWEAGLAKVKEMPVWWCQELGVLADEEVLPALEGDGKISERGGYSVEKKLFKQWVLDIPAYAQRLLQDLDKTAYTDAVKYGQTNWIGKKEGINITYDVVDANEKITVFTTRPDTNYGATFIVLSPEHAFVSKILSKELKVDPNTYKKVQDYVSASKSKSELERLAEGRKKTGVFTGYFVTNTINDKKLPIWIGDFVLADFGTGALVGVPGHDKRDFEFAKEFDLPIERVVVGPDGDTSTITSISQVQETEGKMINSEFLNGMDIKQAVAAMMDYLEQKGWGKRTTTYKIREQVFSRQRYWGEPIPLIYTQDGPLEKVPEEHLPLKLPVMKDFLANDKGIPALQRNTEWNTTVDSSGKTAKRETDTMPTWAGSNWYYIRYIDPHNDKAFADFEKMKYWLPVDKYYGDAGHTTAHLIYSRFWYKFLYDQGMVPTPEPYYYRMSGGMLLGPDHQKMSKSKGNVVNPQDVIENYGADATRMYLAFIGPYDSTYPWNENGLIACFRLLRSIYELQPKVDTTLNELGISTQTSKAFHKMVKKMTAMMEELKMNTSVSELMIFTNHLKTLTKVPADIWEQFLKLLAPFAPFLAEELWQAFHSYSKWADDQSVHLQSWPEFDEALAKDSTIDLPVQINGKVRTTVRLEAGKDEETVTKLALEDENVQRVLHGKAPKKVIYVQDRILNLVI